MVDLTVIVEEGSDNFSAYCPDLPGVIATGRTERETLARLKEAIVFHLEGLAEEKQEIPHPASRATTIRIGRKYFCSATSA